MPWTTLKDLRPIGDPDSNNLAVPNAEEKFKSNCLYYFKDIQVVLDQKDEHFKELVEIDAWFDWPDSNVDQSTGNPVLAIKVLAAKRNDGSLYEKVATAWPPYYRRDADTQERFPGDPDLEPGEPLTFF